MWGGIPQVVTEGAYGRLEDHTRVGRSQEMIATNGAQYLRMEGNVIRCANAYCNRLTVNASLLLSSSYNGYPKKIEGSEFFEGRLYPQAAGKPFPVGVPTAMLEDYNEAWAIIDLSPKSSATLARRCLQAMIRDFCNIKKRSLYHEIEELEKRLTADQLPKGVEPETIQAMRVLKDKGNIGAHMTEVDGKIVEVDSGEATHLLNLIEMLFTDWDVAKHKRSERLKAIESLGGGPD